MMDYSGFLQPGDFVQQESFRRRNGRIGCGRKVQQPTEQLEKLVRAPGVLLHRRVQHRKVQVEQVVQHGLRRLHGYR